MVLIAKQSRFGRVPVLGVKWGEAEVRQVEQVGQVGQVERVE